MDTINLEINWDIPPKNGLKEFISTDVYLQHSVTYKAIRENVYNYYAKLLKKDEANTEETCSEKEDFESPKPLLTPKTNKKEKNVKTAYDKQTSSLSSKEQKNYLHLLQKYSNKVVNAPSEEERKAIQTLADLHAKVVTEQRKFIEYQKSNAKSCTEYSYVHPEADRYVKELVQKKLQSCLCYPRHYITRDKLCLMKDVPIDTNALPSLVCNLLELGRVPKLVSPDLQKCIIQCDYGKMCRQFPSTRHSESVDRHPSKQPISQDSIAKTLADKHSADVVLSFSCLKHLLNCKSLNSNTSWELPVTIVSLPNTDETSSCAKRVLIDKVIPAEAWLSSQKNALYHKYGAKLQFTHFKPSKSRSAKPVIGLSEEKCHKREVVKLQDGFFETEDFALETFGQMSCSQEKAEIYTENDMETVDSIHNVKENKSAQNAKRSPDSEKKASDEPVLQETTSRKKRRRTQEPELLSSRRMTRSQSKKLAEGSEQQEKHAEKKHLQADITEQSSVCQNKSHQDSETNTRLDESMKDAQEKEILNTTKENKCKETCVPENEFSNDSLPRKASKRARLLPTDDESDDTLVIDENPLDTDDMQKISQHPKMNDSVAVSILNDEKPMNSSVSQPQNERINDHSKPTENNTNQMLKTHLPFEKPVYEDNKLSSGEKKDIGSTLDQILHLQEEMLKPKGKLLHNILEQKQQESSDPQPGLPTYLEDASQFPCIDPALKANVQYTLWNMGQHKVIMRSKLDSRQLNSVPCFIFSKLEYQSQFGVEVCGEHELLDQWFTLLCHPGSTGLRVRIDARTSKVLMTEHLTLSTMHNLVAKLFPEKLLCWILNLIEKLKELPDGQYLLAHQKKEKKITLFASAEESKRGDFDLHTAIRQRLVALDDGNSGWQSAISKKDVPWLPIDPDIMLPSLISKSRIPATFPPSDRGEMQPRGKRNSKKKKKKSKIAKLKANLQKC